MALVPIRQLGRRGCEWDGVEALIGLNPDNFDSVEECEPQDLLKYEQPAVRLTTNGEEVIFAAGTVQKIIDLSWGIGCGPANSDTE